MYIQLAKKNDKVFNKILGLHEVIILCTTWNTQIVTNLHFAFSSFGDNNDEDVYRTIFLEKTSCVQCLSKMYTNQIYNDA